MTKLQQILEYAKRGWALFPCHFVKRDGACSCRHADCIGNAGKHPAGHIVARGRNEASTDLDVINRWWTNSPAANVGIATGPESNLVIVDIDPRHNGEASLSFLEDLLGPLPRTCVVRTGSGGLHIYLRYPANRSVACAVNWGGGVDIRAAGGLVIAPPSNHKSGNRYEWIASGEPGEIPAAWLQCLPHVGESAPVRETQHASDEARDLLLSQATAYADKCAPAAEGERNHRAFALAGHLAAFQTADGDSLCKADVLALVDSWNERNESPLDQSELKTIVRSAMSNGTPRAAKVVSATPTTDEFDVIEASQNG